MDNILYRFRSLKLHNFTMCHQLGIMTSDMCIKNIDGQTSQNLTCFDTYHGHLFLHFIENAHLPNNLAIAKYKQVMSFSFGAHFKIFLIYNFFGSSVKGGSLQLSIPHKLVPGHISIVPLVSSG